MWPANGRSENHRRATSPGFDRSFTMVILFSAFSPSLFADPPTRLDERWTVTVNGQTVRADESGGFRIPNIAAGDVFGDDGPGSAPDFKSDDWMLLQAVGVIDGVTWYATSDAFQITQGAALPVENLVYSTTPPPGLPQSLRLAASGLGPTAVLSTDGIGGPTSTRLSTYAKFSTGGEVDWTRPEQGTTYRTSNRRVLDVVILPDRVEARVVGLGTAFVTATNRGAAAVKQFQVTAQCVPTQLVGRVITAGASPVPGATVSTLGGRTAPPGTAADGTFSFSVCYPPSDVLSVVATAPSGGGKALRSDVRPFPNGVTDVGDLGLETDLVFWNTRSSGAWNSAINWHTATVPTPTSRAVINAEDRLAPPPTAPYTVTLSVSSTITDLALDSPLATLTTQIGASPLFQILGNADLRRGKVVWRAASWRGGVIENDVDWTVFGFSTLDGGATLHNRGPFRVAFDNNQGEWFVSGANTAVLQEGTSDELIVEGRLRIRDGAKLTTGVEALGVRLAATGLLEVRGINARFEHRGGLLTVPAFAPGLLVDIQGTMIVDGGRVDIQSGGTALVRGTAATFRLTDGFIRNAGAFRLLGGTTFEFIGGEFDSVASNDRGVIIDGGALRVASTATGPARFTFQHNSTFGSADAGDAVTSPTQVLMIETLGPNDLDRATVQCADNWVNGGVLEFRTPIGTPIPEAELALTNDRAIVNTGLISAPPSSGGRAVVWARSLTNRGTVYVASSTAFRFSGSPAATYVNEGVWRLAGNAESRFEPNRTLGCTAFTNAAGGLVAGSGVLDLALESFCGAAGERTLQNNGVLSPGENGAIGLLRIEGNLTQSAAGEILIELGGTSTGESDQLQITGRGALTGVLRVAVIPGYKPAIGDVFTALTFGSRTGTASVVLAADFPAGLTVVPIWGSDSLSILIVAASSARDLQKPPVRSLTHPR